MSQSGMALVQYALTSTCFNAHSLVSVFCVQSRASGDKNECQIHVSTNRASLYNLGERARAICCFSRPSIGLIRPNDFVFARKVWSLKPAGWKILITAFERRLEHVITHPFFGYRVSMRRLIEVQCRLLFRHFQGEIAEYSRYLPR